MEKKRKLRGKWLVVLGALLMAAGLCMLLLQPSVLQYCIVAPVEEAAPQAGTAQGTEGQAGALEELAETWQARVEEDLSEVLSAASIAARDYGFALSGEGGTATATLTAVGEGWFDVYPRYLVSGRLMTAQELLDGDRLVVLDEPLAFKLFPTTDAVGRELQIGAGRYEVIGRGALSARGGGIRAVSGLHPLCECRAGTPAHGNRRGLRRRPAAFGCFPHV